MPDWTQAMVDNERHEVPALRIKGALEHFVRHIGEYGKHGSSVIIQSRHVVIVTD
jgi:hypothetical protein